jgi:hypothetical protein
MTIDNLVTSNAQFTQALQEMQAAMVRMFPAGQTHAQHPYQPPTWVPTRRRQRRHPLLHRPQHRQRGARVRPTGAQSNPPGTSRATVGPTDIELRLGTQAQPAPPGKMATSLAPPEPTLWAGVTTMWGTPSTTTHRLQPRPDDAKQWIMLPLMYR